MKKINQFMLTCLLLASCSVPAFSQTLELQDATVRYEKTDYPAIEVTMNPGPDEVRDAWEDFLKDKYRVKLKGNGFLANKDVLKAEETKFKVISDKQMDFYTKIVKEGEGTRLAVFASFGYDIYISREKYPKEYATMQDVVQAFLQSYLPEYYEGQIAGIRKNIADLEKDRTDLEKEMKENLEEIEKLTKRNKELTKSISEKGKSIEEENVRLQASDKQFRKVQSGLKNMGGGMLDRK